MTLRVRSLLPLLASLGIAFANGGGYTFGVRFSGTLAPFQASGTQHIHIADERLDILLRRGDADFTVRYTLQNVSGNPAKVMFGFPVELADDSGNVDGLRKGARLNPSQREELERGIQYLKGYRVVLDGKSIDAKFQIEPFATGAIKPFPGSKALERIAGWMVSTATFPAGTSTLEIRYRADHLAEDTFVSDDGHVSPRTCVYRLSTGAVWQGPLAKGTVSVRTDGIPVEEVNITRPRNRFQRRGDAWVWSFQNLEPNLADDLSIQVVPGYTTQYRYEASEKAKTHRSYLERLGRWGSGHQDFLARASSTLAPMHGRTFGPENLGRRQDDPVPWSEGVPGPGVGEWIQLDLKRPQPLLAIGIQGGFISSKPHLFKENGRPAKVELLLNGEHRILATLADQTQVQVIPVLGYLKPVSTVRLTLLEVTAGTRYEDTCISSIVIYDLLSKKPPYQPCR